MASEPGRRASYGDLETKLTAVRRASQTGGPFILVLLFVTLVVLLAWGLGGGRLFANGVPTREELERLDLTGKSGVPPSNPLMMAMLDSLEKVWLYAMYGDRHAIAQATKYMATFTGKYLEFLERLPRQKAMGSRMKRRVRELSDYAERKGWKPEDWLELNKRLVRWADTCISCHLKFRDPDPEWFHGLPVVLRFTKPGHGEEHHRHEASQQPHQHHEVRGQDPHRFTTTVKKQNIKLAMLYALEQMWFYTVYSDLLAVADAAQELSGATDKYIGSLANRPEQKAKAVKMKRRLKALHDYAEERGWEAENSLEMNRHLLALSNSCISCHVKFRDPDPKWFQGFPVAVKLIHPEPEHPERAKAKASGEEPGGATSPAPRPEKGGVKSLWQD